MKVLLCDDDPERGATALDTIRSCDVVDEAVPIFGKRLRCELQRVFSRVDWVLGRSRRQDYTDQTTVFDAEDVDLAIVDNNLSSLDIPGARLTAEGIVGYLRAFTSVPYFISLNKNRALDFDLRRLNGDDDSVADLALKLEHFECKGLWDRHVGQPSDPFLPWYWPALAEAPRRRRAQIERVREGLQEPILPTLDLPVDHRQYLSGRAIDALCPQGGDVERVTFQAFFENACRSLPVAQDRKQMASSNRDDESLTAIARVVAAELEAWLRREILAPQELLVDLPHLLVRYPFLLGDGAGTLENWNEAMTRTDLSWAAPFEQVLEEAKWKDAIWHDRSVFVWPTLKFNPELSEILFGDERSWAHAAFCEDTSRFELVEGDEGSGPTPFRAGVEGPWNQRYLSFLEGKGYLPRTRLAQ